MNNFFPSLPVNQRHPKVRLIIFIVSLIHDKIEKWREWRGRPGGGGSALLYRSPCSASHYKYKSDKNKFSCKTKCYLHSWTIKTPSKVECKSFPTQFWTLPSTEKLVFYPQAWSGTNHSIWVTFLSLRQNTMTRMTYGNKRVYSGLRFQRRSP